MNQDSPNNKRSSRRDFLRKSTVAAVGASIASRIGSIPAVHAAGSDQIRVGLIGCGGRGSVIGSGRARGQGRGEGGGADLRRGVASSAQLEVCCAEGGRGDLRELARAT